MRRSPALPVVIAALLLSGGCAYDGATGYAPAGYPGDYDSGMGSGLVSQPGDLFGGQDVASVAEFDAPLAPYGDWVNSRFGRAFRPDVPQDWRPYVNGRWGEDRLWISDDPWGWATDHYGRWGFDEQIGWVWVPGTEWAPSWVAFRDDPVQNVAGWAPIPPNVSYSLSLGFGSGFGYDSFSNWYAPSWVWVPRSNLYQPGFGGRVLPWRYGANYWGGSRWQYQPGRGGRPALGNMPGDRPGDDWRGRPPQYGQRPPQGGAFPGHPPQGGQYLGRPPQGGQFSGRPPQGGQYSGRPPQGGQYSGRPQDGQYGGRPPRGGNWSGNQPGNGISNGIANGIIDNQARPEGRGGYPGYRGSPGGGGGPRPMAAPEGMAAMPRSEAPRPVATYEAPQRVERAPPPQRFEPQAERPAPTQRIERDPEDKRNRRPQ